ncbi:mitochondrial carrier homolog 2-like isoform X2 [Styela clava]|uniref:mitochondrial carrier homolog 2-like isoform X2 n=1 Tax=Styela clava TaxID=7725 RepID=UPI00193A3527|nr:mitochondrial carrier homolog 2-like isoform X2 [Styela clava]
MVMCNIGHEPLAPVIRRNVFFRKQLQYPNILQYLKHIKTTDGLFGLYRGLQPRLMANLSMSISHMAMVKQLDQCCESEPFTNEGVNKIVKKVSIDTCKEMTAKCCAIIVSHPFHVIALRSMAQFVGHETYYSSFFSSIKEIYNEDGIMGFFVGLLPRLVLEITQIWICNILSHILNTYVLNDQSDLGELRQYSQAVTSYVASVVTYPLTLTSTMVVVSGSRLAAGNPPHMDVYDGWLSCIKDLRQRGLSSRGSSLFFRPVIRPLDQHNSYMMAPSPPIPR